MRLALLTFLASATLTSGFVNPSYNNPRPQVSSLQSTAEGATQVPLVIAGTNIELTDSLTDYVNKRIAGNLNKLSSNGAIRECDVHLSVNKNPKVSQVILYFLYWLFVSVAFWIKKGILDALVLLVRETNQQFHSHRRNLYVSFYRSRMPIASKSQPTWWALRSTRKAKHRTCTNRLMRSLKPW